MRWSERFSICSALFHSILLEDAQIAAMHSCRASLQRDSLCDAIILQRAPEVLRSSLQFRLAHFGTILSSTSNISDCHFPGCLGRQDNFLKSDRNWHDQACFRGDALYCDSYPHRNDPQGSLGTARQIWLYYLMYRPLHTTFPWVLTISLESARNGLKKIPSYTFSSSTEIVVIRKVECRSLRFLFFVPEDFPGRSRKNRLSWLRCSIPTPRLTRSSLASANDGSEPVAPLAHENRRSLDKRHDRAIHRNAP